MEIADTSAWARRRDPRVRPWFDRVAELREIAVCDVVVLELLARVARKDYKRAADDFEGFPWVRMNAADWHRARQVHRLLAAHTAQSHRSVKIPDLLIAAAAERSEIMLVHYDHDFDTISTVTGQATRWIAPRGSLG